MSANPFHAKWFEDVKCRRHGEAACPGCLSYALSDANAAATSARAEGAAAEREAWTKVVEEELAGSKRNAAERETAARILRARGEPASPAYCPIHQHSKWCQHNGGVMGATGYEAPASPAAPKCSECGGPHNVDSGSFCPAPKVKP